MYCSSDYLWRPKGSNFEHIEKVKQINTQNTQTIYQLKA
jgi:hypothetical protein